MLLLLYNKVLLAIFDTWKYPLLYENSKNILQ